MSDDHDFAASDGGVPMIFRTARASQHGESFRTARTITCAGCTCPDDEPCDSRLVCVYCGDSKTTCDAYQSDPESPHTCCDRCVHRAV